MAEPADSLPGRNRPAPLLGFSGAARVYSPLSSTAARPASRRATGTRKGEQET